jgi:hypothetical protein
METEEERLKAIYFSRIAGKVERNLYNFTVAVKELRDASEPFTSGDTVDETGGTIPLMERLENAIKKIDGFVQEN